jgi:ribosomal protein S18 acetylase RimI-like enzyme
VTDAAALLAAYDDQLRGEKEALGAATRRRLGPLWISTFEGGRGFITYRDLDGAAGDALTALVGEALGVLAADPEVVEVEWKTRGHDVAPGLDEALRHHGFVPQEPESIMIGEASLLAEDVPLPEGVRLRAVTEPDDVRSACATADEVFGSPFAEHQVTDQLDRIARGAELWVAEADGVVVSTGRIEPVPGTAFAGIWGGATRPEWRGRGIYRALTAARARSAVERGVRWINSDSTEFSRPILERSGLVKVSTTTPYEWHRADVTAG